VPAVSILRLFTVLVAAVFAIAAPPVKAAGSDYDDAQLQLLFSGSRVEVDDGPVCGNGYGNFELELDFRDGGQLEIHLVCKRIAETFGEDSTGKWWVDANSICIESQGERFQNRILSRGKCWKIRKGRFNFDVFDDGNQVIFRNAKIHHPKYSSKKDLFAALENVRDQPVVQAAAAQSSTQPASQETAAAPDLVAENALGLPPAEYKGLPKGTKVKFRTEDGVNSFMVTRNGEYEYAFQIGNKWPRNYALFGRDWPNAYTRKSESQCTTAREFSPEFDADSRNALRSLWPLKIGKRVAIEFTESTDSITFSALRDWSISFEVAGTEHVSLSGKIYATYVVREDALAKKGTCHQNTAKYTRTLWYHPASGLILKSETEDTRGAASYELVSVTYPEETTTHALTPSKGAPAPVTAMTPQVPAAAPTTQPSAQASAAVPDPRNILGLPPAKYKGLPKGTKVKFRTEEGVKSFTVTKNEGPEYTYKIENEWKSLYALYGRSGPNQYTHGTDVNYEAEFGDATESALAGLWPLTVGKSVAIKFEEPFTGGRSAYMIPYPWEIEFQVIRTEAIELNGKTYASYVIREHAVRGKRIPSQRSAEYTATIWYNPSSGLILKSETEDTRGPTSYSLISVTFPTGTTAHALTPVPAAELMASAPTVQKSQETTEEAVRKQAEELARKMFEEAEAKRKAEAAIAQKAAKEALKKAEAEREKREAEERRIAEQERKQEEARIAAEAERKRKEEQRLADQKRKEEEARIAAEAERKRKEEQRLADQKRKEEEARIAAEAERKRKEEQRLVDQKRKEEEARIAAEAERKREAEERRLAELKRKKEEEARLAAEQKRLEDELNAAKAADAGLDSDERQFAQRGLKGFGFYDSTIDGDFGAGTRSAIKRYQASIGDRETGYLNETQITVLLERGKSLHDAEIAEQRKADEEKAELAKQATSAAQSPSQAASVDFQQKLATLKQVFDAGLLTEPEYQMQKAALLQQFLGLSISAPAQTADDQDEAQWVLVKDSRSIDDVRGYLTRNPNGKHRAEAKTRIKVIKKFASVSGIKFGNYHALIIGNNEYKDLPDLNTAVDDAKAVATVLEKDYGFAVKLLLNAGRLDVVDAFDELRETLSYDDNLLIYYAGHGWLDEESGQGYWLPTDAKPNRRSRWVSNATLKDTLKTLAAKHVMVVADSCFSGTLVRGASVGIKSADYWRKMAVKQTRVAITSGGLEPVADGESNHSPFAKAFINSLRGNDAVMDGTTLFNNLRRPVMVATDQTPAYSDVRGAGHDGGDFLFVKKF